MRVRVVGLAALCLILGFLAGYALAYSETFRLKERNDLLESELKVETERLSEVEGDLADLQINYTALQTEYERLLSRENFSVMLLADRIYFPKALSFLQKANRSIHVALYIVKYDPKESGDPVNALLASLVAAYRRGIDVRVLVDDETNDSYPQTIQYLRQNGVLVKLDKSSGVITHVKMIVIDGRCLFVGSHNWTESALSRNHEYSALLMGAPYAQEADTYFQTLWDEGRIP